MEPARGEPGERIEKGTAADERPPIPGVPVEREALSVGDRIEYCSLSSGKWLRARVLKIYRKSGYCDLDIKRGAASAAVPAGALAPSAQKATTDDLLARAAAK